MRALIASVNLFCLCCSTTARAQYTPAAAQNAPRRAYRPLKDARGRLARDAAGKVKYKVLDRAPGADRHGNACGSQSPRHSRGETQQVDKGRKDVAQAEALCAALLEDLPGRCPSPGRRWRRGASGGRRASAPRWSNSVVQRSRG